MANITIILSLMCSLPAAAQVAPMRGPAVDAPAAKAVDLQSLLRATHAGDLSSRKTAVAAMGAPDNIEAVPHLGAILLRATEPADLRVAAAQALGRVRNWRVLPFLRQSINDPFKEIRFASALSLGKTRSRDAVAFLTKALSEDLEWWVRFAAAVALGESRDPAAAQALGRAAVEEKEWQVRMQAVRSLGQMGSRDAVQALAAPLRDSDPAVRAATAMALGDIGGLDSLNLMTGALYDEQEDFPRQVMSDTIKKLLSRP